VGGQLFDMLNKKKIFVEGQEIDAAPEDFVDFIEFLPYFFGFFIEIEIKKLIKRKYFYEIIKGYPRRMEETGKMVFDVKK
jgi:hypothetical protein